MANRRKVNDVAPDTPFAAAVIPFVTAEKKWKGTASELLTPLKTYATDEMRADPSWPGGANILSGALRRLRLDLRKAGVLFAQKRRIIRLLAVKSGCDSRSTASCVGPEAAVRPDTLLTWKESVPMLGDLAELVKLIAEVAA